MTIHRVYEEVASVVTDAEVVLSSLEASAFYHVERQLRHPVAAYNTSLSQVVRSFSGVLDILDSVDNGDLNPNVKGGNWPRPLTTSTAALLYALFEHIDDCAGILRSFFSPKDDQAAKKAVTFLRQTLKGYRDHVGTIVNYMKHDQRRSCSTRGGNLKLA